MKRLIYRGYVIDTDNLGRQYAYNTASPYSEGSDKVIIGSGFLLKEIEAMIDRHIDSKGEIGIAPNHTEKCYTK